MIAICSLLLVLYKLQDIVDIQKIIAFEQKCNKIRIFALFMV